MSAPKDDHPRRENLGTQPLASFRAFNRADVITEGWYPVCPSRDVAPGQARSFALCGQRLAIYRGQSGTIHALDAFCVHMGADLANGRVVGDTLECYFHQWGYGADGRVCRVVRGRTPEARVHAWPVEERYGWIWVWAGDTAGYPVPAPPGLDGAVVAWHLASPTLYAHHHVMMVGGIDAQHFGSVHGLEVAFDVDVVNPHPAVSDWRLSAPLPKLGWRARLGRWILGDRFGYDARFAGGTVVTLAYGPDQRWRGTGPKLPPLYILWGCVPEPSGVSRVEIFLLAPRGTGVVGWLAGQARLLATVVLLTVLRDDDVKAFPHMRFNPGRLTPEDAAVARLIRFLDRLPISPWTRPEGRGAAAPVAGPDQEDPS